MQAGIAPALRSGTEAPRINSSPHPLASNGPGSARDLSLVRLFQERQAGVVSDLRSGGVADYDSDEYK